MSCPIKVNSNTIELTVHTSCYCVSDLLCVTFLVLDADLNATLKCRMTCNFFCFDFRQKGDDVNRLASMGSRLTLQGSHPGKLDSFNIENIFFS